MSETRDVTELVWREDLYPRFEPNATAIQQYAEALDKLPPVEINQRNEIIDGYHRWTAHRKSEAATISVTVTPTQSDNELLRLAIRRNASHGLQLSQAEKKAKVLQLYTGTNGDKEELSDLFSVSERTLSRWVSGRDQDIREDRNRRIAEMWLACHTEEEIAEAVGLTRQAITAQEWQKSAIWQKFAIVSEYREPDWTPPLYDVWTAASASNKTRHFGMSEVSFVDNLLYMFTEPFDIVVDPFAGGGSTIDVCKYRLRRYWASDRKPIVERRDIREWDILQGPPQLHKRWQDVSLVYLDPPYWRQAQGQYSDDPADLANMPLDEFYATLTGFISACASKMRTGARIALIIQPTQWKADDRRYPADHVVDLILRLPELHYIRRIQAPYSTEQYNAQQVNWAKENRDVLMLSREIIVWETK